jgi:hypothetical protein
VDGSAERACFVLGVSLHYADTFSQQPIEQFRTRQNQMLEIRQSAMLGSESR